MNCSELRKNVIIFILTQYLGHINNSRSFQEHALKPPHKEQGTDTFIQQKLLNIIYRVVRSSTEDNDQNTSWKLVVFIWYRQWFQTYDLHVLRGLLPPQKMNLWNLIYMYTRTRNNVPHIPAMSETIVRTKWRDRTKENTSWRRCSPCY